MKERGMIFNAEMIRAILDGRKTQTRRIVNWRGLNGGLNLNFSGLKVCEYPKGWVIESESRSSSEWRCQPTPCPFGIVGDRIWVRETWAEAGGNAPELQLYRANYPEHVPSHYEHLRPAEEIRWRPSIHMPRWASRLTLEITNVGVQRLQSISQNDAAREGLVRLPASGRYCINQGDQYFGGASHDAREVFSWLWSSIYGDDSWQANPWVWVIEFKQVDGGAA